MKTLYFHIGTEKTGTTTIQRFLGLNNDWFSRHKIYIPSAFCAQPGHHYNLAKYVYHLSNVSVDKPGIHSKQKRYFEEQTCLLENELRFASEIADSCVMSSEHFFSAVDSAEQVRLLLNYLDQFFDRVIVVVYIRDPVWHISSWISTRLRNGINVSSLYPPDSTEVLQRVGRFERLKIWLDEVGRGNMLVKRYGSLFFVSGDLLIDFCHAIGISSDNNSLLDVPRVLPANESLSLTAMRYLYFMNQRFQSRTTPALTKSERDEFVNFLAKHLNDGSRFLPSYRERDEYSSFFRASNEAIMETFFPADTVLWKCENQTYGESSVDLADKNYVDQVGLALIEELWIMLSGCRSRVRSAKNALS